MYFAQHKKIISTIFKISGTLVIFCTGAGLLYIGRFYAVWKKEQYWICTKNIEKNPQKHKN
jgi:hypothetical protein